MIIKFNNVFLYISYELFLRFMSFCNINNVNALVAGRVLLVLMIFSVATIPIHYVASFYFEASATGFSKMCFMNIFTGKFIDVSLVSVL